MRENCPPREDNIWKEWLFGKSPSASLVPTSPHLLRPPPTGSSPFSCSSSYKISTDFHKQPVGASPCTAAAQDSETNPQDHRDHEEPAASLHSGCPGHGRFVLRWELFLLPSLWAFPVSDFSFLQFFLSLFSFPCFFLYWNLKSTINLMFPKFRAPCLFHPVFFISWISRFLYANY